MNNFGRMTRSGRVLNRSLRICAWLCLAYIVFVTLGPIEFRPALVRDEPNLDRFAGYLVLAVLFVWSYPQNFIATVCMVAALAFALEAAQLLTPDRHGHLQDLAFKLLGAAIGFALGAAALRFRALATQQRAGE